MKSVTFEREDPMPYDLDYDGFKVMPGIVSPVFTLQLYKGRIPERPVAVGIFRPKSVFLMADLTLEQAVTLRAQLDYLIQEAQ